MKNRPLKKTIFMKFIFLFCALQGCLLAQAQSTNALDVFKSFKGSWTITSAGKKFPLKMTYDLASKNSVVTEYFGKELSVFYLDGDRLLMTHYCNAGNHPRLKLIKSNDPKNFEFEMIDITNVKDETKEAHVQSISYRIMAQDELGLRIVWRQGKQEKTESYVLTKDQ